MDHQATLIDRSRRDSSVQALTHSLASIAQDMVMIAELQVRLLAVDLRALRQGALRGLMTWMIACGLLVAVLPTALVGTGLWLADVAHVSPAAGLLWVAFGAVLLIIGLFLAGWRQLKRQRVGLQRSRKELRASLAAMRQVLSSYAGRASED
jgi:uncharacterized membrane protein YqjE